MGKSPLFSKNKTDTKMVRRNASDKLRLIQMVHDNPILWDSRLPNFKGAEEEKSRAWQIIGNEFSVPGRRVARAFKSLRESYRRELAHVKMMGVNFQPKWSLFMPMDFLRDVIRERKNGAAHMLDGSIRGGVVKSSSNNNNNNSSSNNNNNNNPMKCHNTNINHPLSLNVPDDYSYFVKPETQLGTQQQHPQQQQQQQQQPPSQQPPPSSHSQHLPDSRTSLNTVTSTHNDSGGNNASAFDDMELSPSRSEDTWDRNLPSRNDSDEVEELEAIDADFPYPLILENPNSPMQAKHRRKANEMNGGGSGGGGTGDYEGQMMHQHRHQQQQHHQYRQSNAIMPEATSQTIREVLNSKFCGFISAKLNSMEDAEADNLMNKILMLLVQTQVPSSQMNGVAATDGK